LRKPNFAIFFLLVTGGATVIVAIYLSRAAQEFLGSPGAFFWLGLVLLVTVLPIKGTSGIGAHNISPLPMLAMLLLHGTAAALVTGWLSGLATVVPSRTGRPADNLQRALLNAGKHTLCILCAGYILWGLNSRIGCLETGLTLAIFGRLMVANGAYLVVSTLVLSLGLWLRDGRDPTAIWRMNLGWKALVSWSAPLGASLLAVFYLNGGFLLIGILIGIGLIGILTVRDHVRIKSSFIQLVDALRMARDGNMPHLKGETQQVMELALAIGHKMRLPYYSLELLERAAMLHNVGYIAVDRETVLKPALLSDAEMNEIREHPESGMRILREVVGMDRVAEIVRSHHESPDGTGYPLGLKSAQIPLEAAIIKIAEAFVAMTNQRPHRRRPLTKDEALTEVAKDAGHALDSTVAYYLFEVMGRPDLASKVAKGFGPPSKQQIKSRVHKPKPKAPALFPHGRKDQRSMAIGACIVGVAAVVSAIFGWLKIPVGFGAQTGQVTGSALGSLFFLFLLGLAALRPVRLPKGAYVSAASAVVLAISLAGGPVYAVIFGFAVVGWAMLLDPATAQAASASLISGMVIGGNGFGHNGTNGYGANGSATRRQNGGIAYILRSKAMESRLSTASAYGFLLILAGSGAWLACESGRRLSSALGLEGTAGDLLPFVLSVGTFYFIETLVQSGLLSANGLSARRIWQRNYLKIFPEPLTYAVCGYAILMSTNLLGLWAAIPLFLFPTWWRHMALLRRLELLKTQESLIRSIARAVDEKDRYTGGHSASVVEIATAIARQMGKSEPFVEQLEEAAIRHDLGKVSWPNQVLRKPAVLNGQEEEEYKWTHPDVSAAIAARAGSSAQVAEMIRYHHERLDGKGYPHKLAGSQIPLGSRILCVADSFDAMVHDRWYKRKRTLQDAIDEVKRCSGTQFDPAIVDAFLAVLEKTDLERLIEAVEEGVGEIPEEVEAAR
jgi:HD-GYP domain-containing protein (c-di-GMP phosphodiesterase class II)